MVILVVSVLAHIGVGMVDSGTGGALSGGADTSVKISGDTPLLGHYETEIDPAVDPTEDLPPQRSDVE